MANFNAIGEENNALKKKLPEALHKSAEQKKEVKQSKEEIYKDIDHIISKKANKYYKQEVMHVIHINLDILTRWSLIRKNITRLSKTLKRLSVIFINNWKLKVNKFFSSKVINFRPGNKRAPSPKCNCELVGEEYELKKPIFV